MFFVNLLTKAKKLFSLLPTYIHTLYTINVLQW